MVSTPLDAIHNPFAPRNHDLPRTPVESEHDPEEDHDHDHELGAHDGGENEDEIATGVGSDEATGNVSGTVTSSTRRPSVERHAATPSPPPRPSVSVDTQSQARTRRSSKDKRSTRLPPDEHGHLHSSSHAHTSSRSHHREPTASSSTHSHGHGHGGRRTRSPEPLAQSYAHSRSRPRPSDERYQSHGDTTIDDVEEMEHGEIESEIYEEALDQGRGHGV